MNLRVRHFSNTRTTFALLAALSFLPGMMRGDQASEHAEKLAARGARLIQACEYEAAEVLLERALELQPNLWPARFNFARIPLRKRDWAEARTRFDAILVAEKKSENIQVLRYEILLTRLLAGEEAAASEAIEQLERNPQSPAARYARAAVARQHDATDEARRWLAAAAQVPDPFAPLYTESFSDLGWEPNDTAEDLSLLSASRLP